MPSDAIRARIAELLALCERPANDAWHGAVQLNLFRNSAPALLRLLDAALVMIDSNRASAELSARLWTEGYQNLEPIHQAFDAALAAAEKEIER